MTSRRLITPWLLIVIAEALLSMPLSLTICLISNWLSMALWHCYHWLSDSIFCLCSRRTLAIADNFDGNGILGTEGRYCVTKEDEYHVAEGQLSVDEGQYHGVVVSQALTDQVGWRDVVQPVCLSITPDLAVCVSVYGCLPLSFSAWMCVCVPVFLPDSSTSVCPSVCQCVSVYVCISMWLSGWLSLLHLSQAVCLFVWLSFCLSVLLCFCNMLLCSLVVIFIFAVAPGIFQTTILCCSKSGLRSMTLQPRSNR